jgi:hypothetical protein
MLAPQSVISLLLPRICARILAVVSEGTGGNRDSVNAYRATSSLDSRDQLEMQSLIGTALEGSQTHVLNLQCSS